MAITTQRTGVWVTDDVHKKSLSGYWDGTNTFTWGYNGYGALGINDSTPGCCHASSPIQLPGSTWRALGGGSTQLGLKTDGTLWTWGQNYFGSAGINSSVNCCISSPIQIPGTTWCSINRTVGLRNSAFKTDGTLWAWGQNTVGQFGLNNVIVYSSPVQIPGTWCTFSLNANGLGIKCDGSLWGAGQNATGGLGQGDCIARSSPVQITGTWCKSSAISNTSSGIKTDNTLWTWGYNGNGELGCGASGASRTTPIQIPGSWCSVETNTHGLALKSDNTLWGWGFNGQGALGDNTTTQRASPIQIPGGWKCALIQQAYGSKALKTDNTLWAWGQGQFGPLGNCQANNTSSPIQIPGTWNNIFTANYTAYAARCIGCG